MVVLRVLTRTTKLITQPHNKTSFCYFCSQKSQKAIVFGLITQPQNKTSFCSLYSLGERKSFALNTYIGSVDFYYMLLTFLTSNNYRIITPFLSKKGILVKFECSMLPTTKIYFLSYISPPKLKLTQYSFVIEKRAL